MATTIHDYEAYKTAIENLANTKPAYTFENSGPEHAAIVLGNIFIHANKSVKIYAGDFNGKVSDKPDYLTGLRTYLAKDKPLTVVFEFEPNPNSKALRLINEAALNINRSSPITLRKLNPDFGQDLLHFTIADGQMARFETSKEESKAVCTFNSPTLVEALEKNYALLFGVSQPLKSEES